MLEKARDRQAEAMILWPTPLASVSSPCTLVDSEHNNAARVLLSLASQRSDLKVKATRGESFAEHAPARKLSMTV